MAICVWNSNTKKELQFSRACMSAQITHSMPPPCCSQITTSTVRGTADATGLHLGAATASPDLPLVCLSPSRHGPSCNTVVRAGGKYLRMAKRIQWTHPVSTSVIQNRLLPTPRQVYTHATHLNTTQSWLLSSHKQSFPGLRICPGAPVVPATARGNCGHHKARPVLRISFSSVLHSSIYILQ